MTRTLTRATVPGASTLGITQADVDAARRARDEAVAEHQQLEASAKSDLAELKDAHDGVLPATAEIRDKVKEIFAETDEAGLEADEARDHLAEMQAKLYGTDPDDQRPTEARGRGGDDVSARMVDTMLQSDEYHAALEAGHSGLVAWQEALGAAKRIQLTDAAGVEQVLSPMAAVTLEPLVGDDQSRLFPPNEFPTRQPRLLDLVSVTQTDKDQVDYAVVTDEQGNVIGAAYGVALGTAAITTEARTEGVKRRGTLLDVPEGVLSDESRLRTWLERKMRRFVQLDTENQMIFGDGNGQNWTGLVNWTGVGTRQRANGQSVGDAIHESITDIRIAYLDEPNAIAFRPETWHTLVTATDDQGGYKNSGGPFGAMPTSIWGKQAVSSTLLRDGTGNAGADPLDCLVGFWPEVEVVIREGIAVREFEQNKDNAEKGMVTIRVQFRGALIVNEPVAFSVLDLEEAAP